MNLVIFIISHGRADNIKTLGAFQRCGYTKDYYIVIDDEDEQGPRYHELYGDRVIEFKKSDYDWVDTCDLIPSRIGSVFPRNALHDIATRMGYEYYAVFDDDYISFRLISARNAYLRHAPIRCFDKVLEAMFEFVRDSGVDCAAFSQIGDFIGGLNSGNINNSEVRRKVMNTFICRTDRRLKWVGRGNEDVNLYVTEGIRGKIFITNFMVAIVPSQTQALKGGLTEFYREYGTYNKSMYTVIQAPSAVKISVVGDKHPRIHHAAKQVNYMPCILDERYRRKRV